MPFVTFFCLLQRLALPVIGLAIWAFAVPAPLLALVALLALRTASSAAGGAIIPAWYDVVAKEIPVQKRGLYSGLSNGVGALLGVAGALLAGLILSAWAYPYNFAACFFIAFGLTMLSWVALTFNREPESRSVKRQLNLAAYVRTLPSVLRRDRGYVRFLVARCLAIVGGMGAGFYMVYGAERFGMGVQEVGLLTALLVGSQAAANLLWAPLADRYGHKRVLCGEVLCTGLAAVAAFAAQSPTWIAASFILLGAGMAAAGVSAMTIVLEYSGPADRPTYVGLTNTSLAPISILAPIFGGWLAGQVGFSGMFVVAAGFSLVALVVMVLWVRDPRHVQGSGRALAT
jgi:MFS family permease